MRYSAKYNSVYFAKTGIIVSLVAKYNVLCREQALFDELLGNLDGVGSSPFA